VKKKTAYRKRLDEEEQQQVIEDKRKRSRDVDWDVVLSHGNGTATPLVFVDGYNVIYQWPRLKKQVSFKPVLVPATPTSHSLFYLPKDDERERCKGQRDARA